MFSLCGPLCFLCDLCGEIGLLAWVPAFAGMSGFGEVA